MGEEMVSGAGPQLDFALLRMCGCGMHRCWAEGPKEGCHAEDGGSEVMEGVGTGIREMRHRELGKSKQAQHAWHAWGGLPG